MEKNILELSVKEFLQQLNSTSTIPSGGSVAGVVLAMGFGLLGMSLSISNKKNQLQVIEKKLEEISENIEKLQIVTNQDAIALKRLIDAYKSKDINLIKQKSLDAVKPPEEMLEILASQKDVKKFEEYISPTVISDFNQALALFKASIFMIKENIVINYQAIDLNNLQYQKDLEILKELEEVF